MIASSLRAEGSEAYDSLSLGLDCVFIISTELSLVNEVKEKFKTALRGSAPTTFAGDRIVTVLTS